MKVTTIIGLVMTVVGFLFMCIVLGTTSWGKFKGSSDTTYGIFKICSEHWEGYGWEEECMEQDSENGTLNAVKAFGILAILASVVGCVIIILSIFMENKIKGKFAAIPLFIAAFCQLIAMSIYADEHDTNVSDYGWGFGLGWATFFYPLVAGVAMVLDE